MIQRILIANRGEIAIRIARTIEKMGREPIVVYSDPDAKALHVELSNERYRLPGAYPADTYLNIGLLIETAKTAKADAIHPGYGFLSENAEFARACEAAGLVFIGPDADTIAQMGSKIRAKELAVQAGVPVVPGYNGAAQDNATLSTEAMRIGFPLLVKASAGGGGKGMRVVHNPDQLAQSLDMARSEAQNAFGDGTLLLERYFTSVKHIEVQIFGDRHGHQVHMFERECSIQRRHQKIIEESPSPSLTPEQRTRICESALALARHIGYVNAGTVEFILDEKGDFYFLEVNTRLQVEHPVTEEVTGLDLVELQVRVADGERLADLLPGTLTQNGHAIECRVYAEDPARNYMPSTGTILAYDAADQMNHIPGLRFRFDSGVWYEKEVTPYYDPMLLKLIVHAEYRDKALRQMDEVLTQTMILGVRTNMAQLRDIMKHPRFVDASFDTHFLETYGAELPFMKGIPAKALAEAACLYVLGERMYVRTEKMWTNMPLAPIRIKAMAQGRTYEVALSIGAKACTVQIDGESHTIARTYDADDMRPYPDISGNYEKVGDRIWLITDGLNLDVEFEPYLSYATQQAPKGSCNAPMPGEVVRIMVKEGDEVKAGQPMLVLSAMKMENTVEAPSDGHIEAILVKEKEQVKADQPLVKLYEPTVRSESKSLPF